MIIVSQAQIVRQLLIDLGVGEEYALGVEWPIFITSETDKPDNAIHLFNVRGRLHGKIDNDLVTQHYGVQVRVRGLTDTIVWAKIAEIQQELAKVFRQTITVNLTPVLVQNITVTTPIYTIGQEVKNRRIMYAYNCIVAIGEEP